MHLRRFHLLDVHPRGAQLQENPHYDEHHTSFTARYYIAVRAMSELPQTTA